MWTSDKHLIGYLLKITSMPTRTWIFSGVRINTTALTPQRLLYGPQRPTTFSVRYTGQRLRCGGGPLNRLDHQ